MENTPTPNENYRDTLAAKIKQERAAGNSEKAAQILEEQQSTILYADAREEQRNSPESIKARVENINRLLEQKKAELAALENAKDVLENNTPAQTQEEQEDKKIASEGFENQIAKTSEVIAANQQESKKSIENPGANMFTVKRSDGSIENDWLADDSADPTGKYIRVYKQDPNDPGSTIYKDVSRDDFNSLNSITSESNSEVIAANQQESKKSIENPGANMFTVKRSDGSIENDWLADDSADPTGKYIRVYKQDPNDPGSTIYKDVSRDDFNSLNSITSESNEDTKKQIQDIENKMRQADIDKDQTASNELDKQRKEITGKTENSITNITENEHGAPVISFDGAEKSDFEVSEKEDVLGNTENQKISNLEFTKNEHGGTVVYFDEAKESDFMVSPQSSQESFEDKKTPAAALAVASERNIALAEQSPKRASWWTRHGKKYLAMAGVAALLLFTPKACQRMATVENDKNNIELVTDNQSICEFIQKNEGYSQVYQKALRNNPEIAKKIGINPEDPTALKIAMEKMKIMNPQTCEELRFTQAAIGSQVEFVVDSHGEVVALVSMDTRPEAQAERYIEDDFGKKTLINNTIANPFNL